MNQILLESAVAAREFAYAPYSGYKVGAAILDVEGNVWTGCNVENVSYGLSICAERTAVVKMVSGGVRVIQAVAVATQDGGTPCGMCLQTLLEFALEPQSVAVFTIAGSGEVKRFFLGDLMPMGFSSDELRRT